ncbi:MULTISPECIES: hypothetical protein [unclassified Streptomyces]|uniref:hypothetical protein n=1 Tax=unclassified Streptomyces TaxID=2593676 RepID=UPI002E29D1E4|nr:hypothetical protein [Streptomyces sp. NBC_00223]
MIAHDLFAYKITAVLIRAGLPIAATPDHSLEAGAHISVDDTSDPPVALVEWRAHPSLNAHFLTVPHDQLLTDPKVRTRQTAIRAMNTAITAVLEAEGHRVRKGEDLDDLWVGQLVVTGPEQGPETENPRPAV